VCAPVVDSDQRLLGAVTVDDVLDHILPADWRGAQLAGRGVPREQAIHDRQPGRLAQRGVHPGPPGQLFIHRSPP